MFENQASKVCCEPALPIFYIAANVCCARFNVSVLLFLHSYLITMESFLYIYLRAQYVKEAFHIRSF